jgi:hypothetical protein
MIRMPATAILLYLYAIHSFLVGLLLIFAPLSVFEFFAMPTTESDFFRAQGGVFHIVMAIAYYFAAIHWQHQPILIRFIIITKTIAFGFLLIYFILYLPVVLVLASAVGDGAMALLLWYTYHYANISADS